MEDGERDSGAHERGMVPRGELEFLPRVRWGFWLPIAAVIAIGIAAYFVTEGRRSRRLHAQLLREHALLTASIGPPYRALRAQIEAHTFSAIGPWQGDYVAPGIDARTLVRTPTLYGRVRIGDIRTAADVTGSIRRRFPDQVATCLGLEVHWVHRVIDRGDFVMPSYIESVRSVADGDRLSALRHDLRFRIERDAGDIIEWSRQRYFMLSVDEGVSSIDGPTRVYYWDLHENRLLFRARAAGDTTVIIPVRIAGMPGGGRPVSAPSRRLTVTEHDCSVAHALRVLLDLPETSLPSVREPPTESAPSSIASDSGAGNDA